MAEETRDPTDEEELKLEAPKAGVAFRAEMAAMDFLLGWWPALLGLVGVGLLAVFAYGSWQGWVTDAQRGMAREIARAELKLPVPVGIVALAPLGGEPITPESMVAVATQLEAVDGSGPGRAEALIKAGELYRAADRPDDARRCWTAASAEASGTLHALAEGALAALDVDTGQADAAVTRYQNLMGGGHGYLSEQAALDLGGLYEQQDKKAEAGSVYAKFLETWPSSPRADEVRRRQGALGAG